MRMHVVQRLTVIVEGVVELKGKEARRGPEKFHLPRLMMMPLATCGHIQTEQPKINEGGQLEMIRHTANGDVRFAVTDAELVHFHEADDQSDFRKREYWKEQW